MAEMKLEILQAAIARNSAAVISLPVGASLHHCKSRFLAEDGDAFWVEADPKQSAIVDELTARQTLVGVAFRAGPNRAIFATPILRREPRYRVNPELAVEAWLLRLPKQISAVQRRSNYRVAVPAGDDMTVRVWKIPEYWILRDCPPASMEITATVHDLSTGGIGLLMPPKRGQPVQVAPNSRLRIQIKYGEAEILAEGRTRHAIATLDLMLRVGVQFSKLENNINGRQTLAKLTTLVGQLRREEARHLRLGIAA
jgi:hypothetical protein